MFWLHNMYERMYNGIVHAASVIDFDTGTFTKTFSPISEDIDEQQKTKLMLDGIQTGLVLAAAPFFHSALSRMSWIKANPNCKFRS